MVYTVNTEPEELLSTSLKNDLVINLKGIMVENTGGTITYSILEGMEKEFRFPGVRNYYGRRVVIAHCKKDYFDETISLFSKESEKPARLM
jgi:hypothetical protein